MPMPAHMTMKGETQGEMAGNCEMQGREGTMLVQEFEHQIYIPSEIQTGLSSGKRVHGSFTVTKVFDKASPMIYQALCTGEHLSEVVLKWYRINIQGQEEHYFTHTLYDAIVKEVTQYMPNCLDKSTDGYTHMEKVACTYRRINWAHEIDSTMAEDDWQVPV